MNRVMIFRILAFMLLLSSCADVVRVEVSNPIDSDRNVEMVELDVDKVMESLSLSEGESFVILDRNGDEIPYQITYDDKVIFPVGLGAKETEVFRVRKGTPVICDIKAYGAHYPDKDDDIAWENDLIGFRMYGHKLDVAAGYDIFVKRGTSAPVLPSFYANEVYSSDAWKRYNELLEVDEALAFRFKMDSLSYHVDRGFGMDCYGVGPTLGAGVAALKDGSGDIIYPYCYDSFEILDNGPLRFTIELTYRPFSIDSDRDVVETRVISLDAGSRLNCTRVSYSGLSSAKDIVAGIVLQDKYGHEVADAEKGYIAYPAPTINVDTTRDVDNGTAFVGHVFPESLKDAGTVYFSDEESIRRGGTKGHVLALSEFYPETDFVYYWGAAWDHSDISSYEEWIAYLSFFSEQVRNPLSVNIK